MKVEKFRLKNFIFYQTKKIYQDEKKKIMSKSEKNQNFSICGTKSL